MGRGNVEQSVSVTAGKYLRVMFCLACTAPSSGAVCPPCTGRLRPAPDMIVGDGLLVLAAYTHDGAARPLIHALKYRGVAAAAIPFAARLAERLPETASGLVPVPRAQTRVIRYGVDPALVLARAVAGMSGIPVVPALRAPLWWRRHAGAGRGDRKTIGFRRVISLPPGAVLIDDVVTTGVTVVAAASALDRRATVVLAATAAPRVGVGSTPVEAA